MKEQVGNVVLNLEYYSGTDLYSDGNVEDHLLNIVKEHPQDDYNRVIAQNNSWPVLYHLSHMRTNIVEWLPITKEDKVLEIGSGCGAITGVLAEKAKQVTCIELSKKRSLINANRNKEKQNIEILVGNFEEVEKQLPEKYDYITLIGVFEYAASYISSDKPYETFLRMVSEHLTDKGKIIMAIENKFGLKYWAGCKEDHLQQYFIGLEGYPVGSGVKTFSKMELEQIAVESGLEKYKFFYPYPDYKFPMSIYSDEYLPKRGELNNNMRNFDGDRMMLFDETKVFDTIVQEGLFPLYSNSYLIILEKN